MNVTIRLLEEKDATVSYLWRNDLEIWKYTGSRPSKTITREIEEEWIQKVLKREDEIRFAICVGDEKEYVGNIQLTNITKEDAELHIFIGNKNFHNKGVGTAATKLILSYSQDILKLKSVYLFANKNNLAAIRSYQKSGFSEDGNNKDQMKLIIKLNT